MNGLNGLDGTVVNLRSVATAPNGIMDTVDGCTKGLRRVGQKKLSFMALRSDCSCVLSMKSIGFLLT